MNKCKVHKESLLKATVAVLFFSFLLWFPNPDGALLRFSSFFVFPLGKREGGEDNPTFGHLFCFLRYLKQFFAS